MYPQQKLGFTLAKGSSQCLVEHPIVSERAPSHLCARYGVEAGGFLLSTTIAMTHPTNKFRRVMRPRACVCVCVCVCLCVCVSVCVCCHLIYSGHQTCGRTSRSQKGERSHRIVPPSFCVVGLVFIARRVHPSPSFVDREVEFCVPPN